jgi:hypothetical protein
LNWGKVRGKSLFLFVLEIDNMLFGYKGYFDFRIYPTVNSFSKALPLAAFQCP